MVALVSRQGRQLQRYNNCGSRLIVGCIPYKLKQNGVEVLVVTSQKREDIMFPKGGWELDETMIQAACREAFEEAGVQGKVEDKLGEWRYKSKSHDKIHEAVMFPLNVNVAEVMAECKQSWMKEALDRLMERLSSSDLMEELVFSC
ncbi:hypothetical protein ZIOFF_067131 [Zingiber officinale]|uniref:Nudix hydrolase domain-containing protein n=1 Tax=Zingiber officinale TaxID=94328 RepID=A0A8J5BJB9_ZINOF|nr:hypothetical protein ZIOFF_067131 [Zingiber officinale]